MQLPFLIAAFGEGGDPTYTLSGETGISSVGTPGPFQAGVRVNSDGTIDKRETASYTQIDAATDWKIPNSVPTGANVRIRCTDNNANLHASSDATGSWLLLTVDREWWVEQSGSVGSKALDITLEISLDGGSTVHDSASYTGLAQIV